jgi:hypothetical protein
MLKTLDILIGATTVLLLFSMAVTVITQFVTTMLQKRGQHLCGGLASLLQQLGISNRAVSETIAKAVLTHPTLSMAAGKMATVIHRHEFTKLLMDIASGQTLVALEPTALAELKKMLAANGVSDPGATLSNIRQMALLIETTNPEIASPMREQMAILQECATHYVAKINSWFDQTMDRVSQAFAKHAHIVTVCAALLVVLAVQLDIIAVVDRLSIDDQFRTSVVTDVAKSVNSSTPNAAGNSVSYNIDPNHYYNLLDSAGLITLPTSAEWVKQIKDVRKIPGMILSILLVSLGAPFWYNILKDLLGLRSTLAQNDDQQRAQRQQASPPASSDPPGGGNPGNSPALPASLQGERGILTAG